LTLAVKALANADARIISVRHRSHATFSRQPRQVRKEATVTGSDVCSESPVSGLFFSTVAGPGPCPSDYRFLHFVYLSFRKKVFPEHP